MVPKEELKCGDDIWYFDDIKKFTLASFYKWQKEIYFYSFNEIFIRSDYDKSLLIREYMLFVIKMYFYAQVFLLLPDSSTYI